MNDIPDPLVSIITRTQNRPKLLEKALRSAASQTYRPIEIVLVNDGGDPVNPDFLHSLSKELEIQSISNEQVLGRAESANVGLRHARGTYLNFLDDDDILLPEHVSTMVRALEECDFRVATSNWRFLYTTFDIDRQSFKEKRSPEEHSSSTDPILLLQENSVPFMCLMFHRSALETVGLIDPSLELYEDWDFIIRLSKCFPFLHVPMETALYRQWDNRLQLAFSGGQAGARAYAQLVQKHWSDYNPGVLLRFYHEKKRMEKRLEETSRKLALCRETNKKLAAILKRQRLGSVSHLPEVEELKEEHQRLIKGMEQMLEELSALTRKLVPSGGSEEH